MVRSCQQGLVMALRRQRRAQIFLLWNVWWRALNQMVTFPQLFKMSKKNFTLPKNIITDFSLARVLCGLHCMMNKSLSLIYTARVCGALQPHGHRSWSAAPWQVSEAALRAAQSRSSLYAEYASCVGPLKHQGAPCSQRWFHFSFVLEFGQRLWKHEC